jgi:hypothetical protein
MFFSHQGFYVNWGFPLFLSPVVTVKLITNLINSNSKITHLIATKRYPKFVSADSKLLTHLLFEIKLQTNRQGVQ